MLLEVGRTLSFKQKRKMNFIYIKNLKSFKQNDFRYRKNLFRENKVRVFKLLNKESSECPTHNKTYCKALHLDL